MPYAIALAKGVEPYKIKWIEEFLPPDDYDGYEQVKKGKGRINLRGEPTNKQKGCLPDLLQVRRLAC